VRVPVGTSTGWNTRTAIFRGPDLCGLSGAFVPFAKTGAERLASGDPRRSLQERYTEHAGFVKAVEQATSALVTQRFLLQEDANRMRAAAEASDVLTGASLPASVSR